MPRISSPVAARDLMAVSRPDPGPFTLPALAQDRVFPSRSVMVTMVLLKVDLMWAWPWEMFLRSRRLGFLVFGLATLSPYFPFLRRTPTVFFGPFRVRALVWVRCPRTGRLRRWRMPW